MVTTSYSRVTVNTGKGERVVRRILLQLSLPLVPPESAFQLWVAHVWHGGGGLGKPHVFEELVSTSSAVVDVNPSSGSSDVSIEQLKVHRTRRVPGMIIEQVVTKRSSVRLQ